MKARKLKQVIKPPFTVGGSCIYDKVGLLLEICTSFVAYENGAELNGEFAVFVEEALIEKWKRKFGKPLRWEIKGDGFNISPYLVCPKCNEEPGLYWDGEDVNSLSEFRYCPRCGQRLLPPEEK